MRGKVYGLLQLTSLWVYDRFTNSHAAGWIARLAVRIYITAHWGSFSPLVILFGVREPPRGQSEPEMENLEKIVVHRFDKKIAIGLFKKRSLLLLFAQGFVGVFPWNVITYWILPLPGDRAGV